MTEYPTLRDWWCLLRYGEWSCGWEYWTGSGRLSCNVLYYDGWHAGFRIGKFYLSVSSF
jgi:hypothetical protein